MDVIQRKKQTENGDYVDMDGAENPCIRCGACCSQLRVSFPNSELSTGLLGSELGVPEERTVSVTPFLSAMKGTEFAQGPCHSLEGTVGEKVTCQIYHQRPSPCRLFWVWDEQGMPNPICQRLRAQIGLAPLPFLHSR